MGRHVRLGQREIGGDGPVHRGLPLEGRAGLDPRGEHVRRGMSGPRDLGGRTQEIPGANRAPARSGSDRSASKATCGAHFLLFLLETL